MIRGEIWWVDFGEPYGSAPAYRRPAVIIQNDEYNINTTIVLPLTTNLQLADFIFNYYLPAGISKLNKDSVVVTPQITVIDKSRLIEKISTLPNYVLYEIEKKLTQKGIKEELKDVMLMFVEKVAGLGGFILSFILLFCLISVCLWFVRFCIYLALEGNLLVLSYWLYINAMGFGIMGKDKEKAEMHKWRISELDLFGIAILGGSIGMLLGMIVFDHKVKKRAFTRGIPILLLVQIIFGILLYQYF